MQRISKFISTFAGIGYFPVAPGSVAAAIAVLVWISIQKYSPVFSWQLPLVVAVCVAGIYFSAKQCETGEKDPSHVVIDEVAGMWISLLFIPYSLLNFIVAFVLFRFFDIVKPFGVRKMERLKNGWGIMMDDVLAGIYSNFALRLLILLHVW